MGKIIFQSCVTVVVLYVTILFFFYPAAVVIHCGISSTFRETAQPPSLYKMYQKTAARYGKWADRYLDSGAGQKAQKESVAATEWPMFGSVFFLLTSEEMHKQHPDMLTNTPVVAQAVEKAADLVASPATAAWVKELYGERYLEEENVFYRMCYIMGLSSYERITGNTRYHEPMAQQVRSLSQELTEAPFHVANDYPNECYPNDVLWAIAAIQRAGKLDNSDHGELVKAFLESVDGPLLAPEGLPGFSVMAKSGRIEQNARGCGNSGILTMAAELDPIMARRWYDAYDRLFWVENRWYAGFREMPLGDKALIMDVDSGPVVFGLGFVASAFGIGASRALGRYDHTVPLTMEALALSWPTPFGFLIPGAMGWSAADGWCLGETALLFSMTRPTSAGEEIVPFQGSIPAIAWIAACGYILLGFVLISCEIRGWLRWFRKRRQLQATPKTEETSS